MGSDNSWAGRATETGRLAKKEEMIAFYEEEMARRKGEHRKEKEQRSRRYEATIRNLKYLLGLEQKRGEDL